MRLESTKTYALIQNGIVATIISGKEVSEISDHLLVVEIPSGIDVYIGMTFDMVSKSFIEPSLEAMKANKLAYINDCAQSEATYLRNTLCSSNEEIYSWDWQEREAKEYQDSKGAAMTPILKSIAEKRGVTLESLVEKILTKNNEYKERLGKIIGYRQVLEKQIEAAESKEALEAIKYTSPLLDEVIVNTSDSQTAQSEATNDNASN